MGNKVSKEVLFRIYKRFKRGKNKVYILNDFNLNKQGRVYFDILIKFNIIERVPTIYKHGINHAAHREVIGYRYNNNINNPSILKKSELMN